MLPLHAGNTKGVAYEEIPETESSDPPGNRHRVSTLQHDILHNGQNEHPTVLRVMP
jgi:hypothetical protein